MGVGESTLGAYHSKAGSVAKPPSYRRRIRAEAAPAAPKSFFRAYPGSQRAGEKIEYSKRDQTQRP